MNLDRDRARVALQEITAMQDGELDKYVSYVKGLPATIMQNGLGQALATLLAASKGEKRDDHYRLYTQLEEWLCRVNRHSPYHGKNNLMRAITSGTEEDYILAQGEALAYLHWLKKFATAYLSGKGQQQGETS
ncbi:MAG TPA: type III-B CRISPR module-associated protein Cmr5 [Gammaproteobacteria bacterium]|nr:type III-B CRISPR module-associated protein Cmr5 [Gammaproteobacteria bacterium]